MLHEQKTCVNWSLPSLPLEDLPVGFKVTLSLNLPVKSDWPGFYLLVYYSGISQGQRHETTSVNWSHAFAFVGRFTCWIESDSANDFVLAGIYLLVYYSGISHAQLHEAAPASPPAACFHLPCASTAIQEHQHLHFFLGLERTGKLDLCYRDASQHILHETHLVVESLHQFIATTSLL